VGCTFVRCAQPDRSAIIANVGLEVRPIEAGDKAGLASALAESSSEAIYRRFLGPHGPLSAAELRYLTEVDHHDHEALVAIDHESDRSVGVARFVRDPKRRDSAAVAFAVLEAWQGRGVGKALMRGLAERARQEGVSRFTALMLAHNSPMRHLLAELGPIRVLSRDGGSVELAVDLGSSAGEEGVDVGGELGVVLEEEAVRGVRVDPEARVRDEAGQ
jgi:GNAT superfamily N-acetyltransferase